MSDSARQLAEEQRQALARARWLEALWIVGLISIVVALYFTRSAARRR